MTTSTAMVTHRNFNAPVRVLVNQRCNTVGSSPSVCFTPLRNTNSPSTGTKVTASTQLIIKETNTTANKEYKNSPVASSDNPIPEKAAIPITVAPNKGHCVRFTIKLAASLADAPVAIRSIMPSATTIALSTNIPMAITIAPRDMR